MALNSAAVDTDGLVSSTFAPESWPDRFQLSDKSISKAAANTIIRDKLMLQGKPRLNLASPVSTWTESECDKLILQAIHNNHVDADEYPDTTELQNRCVHIIADLLRLMCDCVANAKALADDLARTGQFNILSRERGIPLVAFSLNDSGGYDEHEISEHLRRLGWIVPAHTMAPEAQQVKFMCVVFREDFNRIIAGQLVRDREVVLQQLDPLLRMSVREATAPETPQKESNVLPHPEKGKKRKVLSDPDPEERKGKKGPRAEKRFPNEREHDGTRVPIFAGKRAPILPTKGEHEDKRVPNKREDTRVPIFPNKHNK